MRRFWVVEMRGDISGRWEPTMAVSFSREESRRQLQEWQADDPHEQFRLVAYVPRAKGGGQ